MSVGAPKRLVLDADLGSLAEVYAAIEREFALGSGFGRNLDALWDSLSRDVIGPIEIVWTDSRRARRRLGADFDRLVDVLREVERTRPDFRLVLA